MKVKTPAPAFKIKKPVLFKKLKKEKILTPEQQIKSFLQSITPSVMDFKHKDYYIVGNTFRSVYAIREYPTSTEDFALLKEFGESDGITLHVYTRPITHIESNNLIRKTERRNKGIRLESKRLQEQVQADENIAEVTNIIKKMHSDKEVLYNCAVFIEMTAASLEKLIELKGKTEAMLNRISVVIDKLWLNQKKGFECVKIGGQNAFFEQFERALPLSSVSNLFPFSYSGKTDPNGYSLGKDINGSHVIVDFDRRTSDITNPHILILGDSGLGKSYLLKLIQTNLRQAGKKIFTLDVDDEYWQLTVRLGGTSLDMMSGKYIINVLEPKIFNLPDEEDEALEDDNEDYAPPAAFLESTRLNQHIAFLRDFFVTYKPLTLEQLDTLEIILSELYENFGINDSNIENLQSSQFPTLKDLHDLMTEKLGEYDDSDKNILYTKDTLRSLCLSLQSICIGNDSVFFNGHTNIPNGDHINFCVRGVINTNDNLKNAMYFNIFSYISSRFLIEGNSVAIFDELHELLNAPLVVAYIRSFAKRGRKKDSLVALATQNVQDLLLPKIVHLTSPLLSIPKHKFLFSPGECEKEDYMRILSLRKSEYEIIKNSSRGACLYCAGKERYHLKIIAPEHKSALFGTKGGR